MKSPSSNNSVNAANSLEISADIYSLSLSAKLNPKEEDASKAKPANRKESKPLAEIMKAAKIKDCPCCNGKKALSDKPIYVEKREGQEALFLEEEDIAISVTDVTMVTAHEEKEEEPKSLEDLITKIVKQDSLASFSPF